MGSQGRGGEREATKYGARQMGEPEKKVSKGRKKKSEKKGECLKSSAIEA